MDLINNDYKEMQEDLFDEFLRETAPTIAHMKKGELTTVDKLIDLDGRVPNAESGPKSRYFRKSAWVLAKLVSEDKVRLERVASGRATQYRRI